MQAVPKEIINPKKISELDTVSTESMNEAILKASVSIYNSIYKKVLNYLSKIEEKYNII